MKSSTDHWNTIFSTKSPHEVSWTQEIPEPSISIIKDLDLPTSSAVCDMGGGSSLLPDFLLKMGFDTISVVDISAEALSTSQKRLEGSSVNWIESDMRSFVPTQPFDLWHDRAAFHFLTDQREIEQYVSLLEKWVSGYVILGAFSENGPLKCSGLPVTRYSKESLSQLLSPSFTTIKTMTLDHQTPFGTKQNFVFGVFKKRD